MLGQPRSVEIVTNLKSKNLAEGNYSGKRHSAGRRMSFYCIVRCLAA